jgi:hypothetical protein
VCAAARKARPRQLAAPNAACSVQQRLFACPHWLGARKVLASQLQTAHGPSLLPTSRPHSRASLLLRALHCPTLAWTHDRGNKATSRPATRSNELLALLCCLRCCCTRHQAGANALLKPFPCARLPALPSHAPHPGWRKHILFLCPADPSHRATACVAGRVPALPCVGMDYRCSTLVGRGRRMQCSHACLHACEHWLPAPSRTPESQLTLQRPLNPPAPTGR